MGKQELEKRGSKKSASTSAHRSEGLQLRDVGGWVLAFGQNGMGK
jgi:hypothetical protein